MLDAISPEYSTKEWQNHCPPKILGRYEVLGILGQGGIGTVFKGYHVTLKRYVAIKTLRFDKNPTPDQLRRFLREMESAGTMDHPNVVRATDAGECNGVLHLVMEYLPGTDLGRLVTRKGPLPPSEACELIRQAAAGLDYIHQTLFHRDIKPSNLMLTTGGLVKILDLGLARFREIQSAEEQTPTGYVMGTYDYMAPEQGMAGGVVDARTDIYSLGCTLFKLLTGRAPYSDSEHDSPAKKISAHLHVPLSVVAGFAELPNELQHILLRMTAKKAADRYRTAAEVERALQTLATDSQPLQLLDVGGAAAPHGEALPSPHELSRMTGVPADTFRKTPHPTFSRILARPRMLLGVSLAVAAAALSCWFFLPALLSGLPKEKDKKKNIQPLYSQSDGNVRDLDELPGYALRPLLDQTPVSVSGETVASRLWHWDAAMEQLDSTASHAMLFKLGRTSRQRFMVEASINQSPWTGRVGFFWGYTEDKEKKLAKEPNLAFATFQMIAIISRPANPGRPEHESGFAVQHGIGSLSYRKDGHLQVGEGWNAAHEIGRINPGAKSLSLEIISGQLVRAKFNGIDLGDLGAPTLKDPLAKESWHGELGFFALEHQATISQVRFMAYSPRSGDN